GERFYGDLSTPAVWAVAGHGTHKPRRWDRLPPDVPAILQRALSPNTRDRYPSCGAMRDALMRARESRFSLDDREMRTKLTSTMQALFADKIARENAIKAGFSEHS